MPTRNKNLVTLSSIIHVQVDSMGFYFQQTRFQMPASPYRRGKAMCLEQDTIGSGCTMGAPPRLKFVEGFARERGRVIRFHPRGCLYLLKIVLLSFLLFFTIPSNFSFVLEDTRDKHKEYNTIFSFQKFIWNYYLITDERTYNRGNVSFLSPTVYLIFAN